jgi:type II secretory pathway pseudopilin PulG
MTIDYIQIIVQVFATGGLLLWMTKRHSDKLDKLSEDLAVVRSAIVTVRDDHDRLITLESNVRRIECDLSNYIKRSINNGQQKTMAI